MALVKSIHTWSNHFAVRKRRTGPDIRGTRSSIAWATVSSLRCHFQRGRPAGETSPNRIPLLRFSNFYLLHVSLHWWGNVNSALATMPKTTETIHFSSPTHQITACKLVFHDTFRTCIRFREKWVKEAAGWVVKVTVMIILTRWLHVHVSPFEGAGGLRVCVCEHTFCPAPLRQ